LRNAGNIASQPHPAQPACSQRAKSSGTARIAICPLMVELPPTPRPRHNSFGSCACVRRANSAGQRKLSSPIARIGLGMLMCSGVSAERKLRPASSSNTRIAGSSLSRAASTAPAEPAPTMM
jgi:hypothetical protein